MAILGPEPPALSPRPRFLGSDDLRLYEAELWAKYAGAVDYDQSHHRDFGNHTLVVPKRSEPPTQMQSMILLSDVAEGDGPTRVVPLSVGENLPYWPGSLVDGGTDLAQTYLPAGTFAGEEVSVTGPAGTLFSYRPDVLHRGSRMTGERSEPIHHLRSLRRVGATLDRQSRLARQSAWPRLAGDDREGDAPGTLGLRVPRTGRSVLGRTNPGRYPGAPPGGRLDSLPVRPADHYIGPPGYRPAMVGSVVGTPCRGSSGTLTASCSAISPLDTTRCSQRSGLPCYRVREGSDVPR